ncbi:MULTISPECIES: hypothetical protein [Halomonas]|uniref:hypothetical protein n=1 Tax=Halomonas TaxID=2745 RepID=UPI001C960D86|nr:MULTISPECIES: hypothetical protein [Halomonas]MBY6207474.1 hypothetical protein [Halomonas sp. DP3Y7-2]MBY6228283.1 hypothetical protein [Halomonas sp. DP3Y7-1]MCA0916348.1 hypothetical protein [Halomonas denitrificans]
MPVDAKYKHEQAIDIEKDLDGDIIYLELNLSDIISDYVSDYSDIDSLLNKVQSHNKIAFVAEHAAKEASENGTGELNERLMEHGFKIVKCE